MATPSPSSAPSQKVTSAKTSHPTQRRGATEEPAGRAKKDLTPKAAATQKPTIRQPATSNHSGHTISTPIQQAGEKLRGHGEPSAHEKKTATTPSRDDELFELFGHPDKERSAWESTSEGENWDLFSEQNIEAVMRPLQQQPAQQTSVSPTPEAPQQQEAAELMPPSRDVSTEQETAPEEKDERPSPQEPGHTAAAMPEQADSGVPTTSGDDAIMGELSEPAHKPAHDSYSLPPQLQQPGKSSVTTLLWGGGILLLLGCLVLQYIYYYRSSLSENDTLRPLLDAMCQVTECQLPPRRDLGKIELADHLMQYHPRYKNSLLITATLVNRADYVQPFPLVEVVMTDLEQKVIARRHFRPEQYLIGDAPGQQFLPNTEIPLMLEVVDPGESAVGFEFHFY